MPIQRKLQPDDQLTLARQLSDELLFVMDKEIADRLRAIRDAVWPAPGQEKPNESIRRVFHENIKNLTPDEKTQLLEAYARLGHIYEIAGLATRHDYFTHLEREGKNIPGGVAAFVESQEKAAEAAGQELSTDSLLGQLSQPVFEMVMTMHPTNTNSLESMKAQRRLAKALESGNDREIRSAVRHYATTPVVPQKKGKDVRFTVGDETDVVLNYLGNIYEDFPKTYAQYDRALGSRADYRPLDLKLNFRFSSWGSSGDKDGNNNVTAETTLDAIARHTAAIVDRYKDELKGFPGFYEWKGLLGEVSKGVHDLLPQIEELRKDANRMRGDKTLLPFTADLNRRFDELSGQLAGWRAKLDAGQFERDVTAAYEAAPQDDLLGLIRKIRTFGFSFSKIEYRETAKEYERVVAALVENYDSLTPQARVHALTGLLTAGGNQAKGLLEKKWKNALSGAAGGYSDDDAMPILYHTLKRMELARDFPDMIENNVLAECGQGKSAAPGEAAVRAQGVANLLEAQFVQRLAEKDGKAPLLGIVPLFEEPATMEHIGGIMEDAYQNPAYRQHLEALKPRTGGRLAQQVQIAHSDNARRSGLQAARALIHKAHKKMREVNDRHHIQTQFFEGGSVSDAYRNGVRSISATIDDFDLHDFAKLTFQGGDLVNYLSAPSSNVRLFTRSNVHAARNFKKQHDGAWEVVRREPNGNGHAAVSRRFNTVLDEIAVEALIKTLPDYQEEDFKPDKMGILLAALDFHAETKAGSFGSRQPGRKPMLAQSVQMGVGNFDPVDIDRVRTISFSEAWQHAGIVPSWIGSQKLEEHLRSEIVGRIEAINRRGGASTDDERYFMKNFGDVAAASPLSPRHIHELYEHSPTFKDAQDRAAFALAMTDPESLEWLERRLRRQGGEVESKGMSYLNHINRTYARAGRTAYAARTGKELAGTDIRTPLTEALPRLSRDIQIKSRYREFLLFNKINSLQGHGITLDDHQRAVVHNAGDIVVHGRFPTVDDPAYGESYLGYQAAAQNVALAAAL